jgi:hypothetical protein
MRILRVVTALGAAAGLVATPSTGVVAVAPGEALELVTDVRSTGLSSLSTAGLVYLGPLGQVMGTVQLITAPLSTTGFTTLERTVTVPVRVVQVRVLVAGFAPTDGATNDTVTFDDVGLFAQ